MEPGRNPLPVFFFQNSGQAPARVKYVARTPELTAYFSEGGASLRLHGADLQVSFVGANPATGLEPAGRMPGTANFFTGDQPEHWTQGVNLYAKVIYRALYPGIDMNFGGTARRLKSEFVVAPGADPKVIRVRYKGFEHVSVEAGGDLRFEFGQSELRDERPEVYQVIRGERVRVPCRYDLRSDGSVGFVLGAYDTSRELVIDPVLLQHVSGGIGIRRDQRSCRGPGWKCIRHGLHGFAGFSNYGSGARGDRWRSGRVCGEAESNWQFSCLCNLYWRFGGRPRSRDHARCGRQRDDC